MNTQVPPATEKPGDGGAPAGSATEGTSAPPAPPVVAETIPVIVAEPLAAPAPPVAAPVKKSLMDDFLDDDDSPESDKAEVARELVMDDVADDASDDSIPEFEADSTADSGDSIPGLEGGASSADDDADIDALDDLEDTAEEQSMAVIDVYKEQCTNCTHLVPWGEKTFKRCHFSNGNEDCPAQSMRIRRLIPFGKIIPRFLAAEEQNDTDRLLTLYGNLKKKPQDVQDEIHAKLKEAREARTRRKTVAAASTAAVVTE